MLTGAGSSIPFGYPSTQDFTNLIESNFKADAVVSSMPQVSNFYDQVISDLKNYFLNPGIITFENIYQAIQDVMVLKNLPTDPKAFDEFRPHVGASHELKVHYAGYTKIDGNILQDLYLKHILQTFLDQLANVADIAKLKAAITYLEKKFVIRKFPRNNLPNSGFNKHIPFGQGI